MEFQEFLDYLSACGFDFIAQILSIIFGLILVIVQIKKYKINSNQTKELKLKYRKENYQSEKGFEPFGQKFQRVVPVYELDENTHKLVVVGTKDLQEIVQSSRDCGLDIVLEKYGVLPPALLPQVSSRTDEPYDATDLREDLIILADMTSDIEELRLRYNMPGASLDSLQKHISQLKSDVDKTIQDELLNQSKKEASKNEV